MHILLVILLLSLADVAAAASSCSYILQQRLKANDIEREYREHIEITKPIQKTKQTY